MENGLSKRDSIKMNRRIRKGLEWALAGSLLAGGLTLSNRVYAQEHRAPQEQPYDLMSDPTSIANPLNTLQPWYPLNPNNFLDDWPKQINQENQVKTRTYLHQLETSGGGDYSDLDTAGKAFFWVGTLFLCAVGIGMLYLFDEHSDDKYKKLPKVEPKA